MTTIFISRHGNTFGPGDKVVRIGRKTDIGLSTSGIHQAERLGLLLLSRNIKLSAVYTGTLKRTIETAQIALEQAKIDTPIYQDQIFDELDYGPDEGKTNEEIIQRIGDVAMKDWEHNGIIPPDWNTDPNVIINNWINFADKAKKEHPNGAVLIVTSNGIIRFAPYITGHFLDFIQEHNIKVATGSISEFVSVEDSWKLGFWNFIP